MDVQKTLISIFLNIKSKSVSIITALYKLLVWPPRTFCLLCSLSLNFLLDKAKSTVLKLLFLWVILITLASFSILFYAFFYHVYIPTAEISKTVHLTFRYAKLKKTKKISIDLDS